MARFNNKIINRGEHSTWGRDTSRFQSGDNLRVNALCMTLCVKELSSMIDVLGFAVLHLVHSIADKLKP